MRVSIGYLCYSLAHQKRWNHRPTARSHIQQRHRAQACQTAANGITVEAKHLSRGLDKLWYNRMTNGSAATPIHHWTTEQHNPAQAAPFDFC